MTQKSKVIFRLGTPKSSEQQSEIRILQNSDGKPGLPAFLSIDGLPDHAGRIYVNRATPDSAWLVFKAPVRKLDAEGNFIFQPRINEDGNYLNSKGEVVNSEADAATNFEYVKLPANKDATQNDLPLEQRRDKIFFETLASINLENTKRVENSDAREPAKQTFANIRLINDADALEVARKRYSSTLPSMNEEQKSALLTEVRGLEKTAIDNAAFTRMFINYAGAEMNAHFVDRRSDETFVPKLPERSPAQSATPQNNNNTSQPSAAQTAPAAPAAPVPGSELGDPGF